MFYGLLFFVSFPIADVCSDLPLNKVDPKCALTSDDPCGYTNRVFVIFENHLLSVYVNLRPYRFRAMTQSLSFCNAFLCFSRTVYLIPSLKALIVGKGESRPSALSTPPLALSCYPIDGFLSHTGTGHPGQTNCATTDPGQCFMKTDYQQSNASFSYVFCCWLGCQSGISAPQSVYCTLIPVLLPILLRRFLPVGRFSPPLSGKTFGRKRSGEYSHGYRLLWNGYIWVDWCLFCILLCFATPALLWGYFHNSKTLQVDFSTM